MTLRRWDPFDSLVSLRRYPGRLLDDRFFRPWRMWHDLGREEDRIPLDVYQTPDDLVVKATIPGVKPEDVKISITGKTLSIRADTKAQEENHEEDYFVRERRYGSYVRTISLPSGLDTGKAEASFEDGVLTLTIPKVEDAKPREVKVKVHKA